MSLTQAERTICEAIESEASRLFEVSDTIHGYAEMGYQEYRSSALLACELARHDLGVTRNTAGLETAFDAVLPGGISGPDIALLAEYDALPGLGHACGHNLIGTAALGAAVGLRAVREQFPGRLHVFGTPAEEGFSPDAGGKVVMFHAGVFEGMRAVLMIHPGEPFTAGGASLARDNFRLVFRGHRPGVGQPRWDFADSQDALTLTQVAIQVLRGHVSPDVVIECTIEKGGDDPNIVSIESVARMYVRAKTMKTVEQVVARVMDCARGAAAAIGGTVEYQRHVQLYDEVVTNPTIDEVFMGALHDAGVPEDDIAPCLPGPVTHLNDLGIISKHIPSIAGSIVVGPRGLRLHTAEAAEATRSEAAHKGLIIAAKSLALTAWRLANDPRLLDKADQDLATTMTGQ